MRTAKKRFESFLLKYGMKRHNSVARIDHCLDVLDMQSIAVLVESYHIQMKGQ